jgi:hypothetical protein
MIFAPPDEGHGSVGSQPLPHRHPEWAERNGVQVPVLLPAGGPNCAGWASGAREPCTGGALPGGPVTGGLVAGQSLRPGLLSRSLPRTDALKGVLRCDQLVRRALSERFERLQTLRGLLHQLLRPPR